MQDVISVNDFETFLNSNSKNLGLVTINLEHARFKFVNKNTPTMTVGSSTYLLSSKWVIKQLCKIIGVSEKFYRNCPEDLAENVFNTHILMLDDNKRTVQLSYVQEGDDLVLRAILNSKYFNLTNLEIFSMMKDHVSFSNIKGVFLQEGGKVFDEILSYKLVTNDVYTLNNTDYNKGYLVKSSELEGSKLMITPVLIHTDSSAFIPMTVKGKPVLSASYVNPQNGTLVPLINSCLAISDTYFKDYVSTVNGEYKQDINYTEVYSTLDDWETRRDIPKSVVKKSRKTIDSYDVEDESIACVGDLCTVVLEESLGSFNKEFKVGKFVGQRLGFSVESSSDAS